MTAAASAPVLDRHGNPKPRMRGWIHRFASFVALPAAILLVVLAPTARARIACAIYGITLVVLYTSSTLYHSAVLPERKRKLRIFDHLAIFLLIAGTYTPFVLIALRGAWGWTLFAIVWSLAAVGTIIELSQLARFRRVMVALYIAMGWVGLIAIKPLVAALPAAGLWLVFGRSEERRVGKECELKCRSRWSPYH